MTLLTEVGDAVCWEDRWGLLWGNLGHPRGDIQKEGGYMGPRLERNPRGSPVCVGGEACELMGQPEPLCLGRWHGGKTQARGMGCRIAGDPPSKHGPVLRVRASLNVAAWFSPCLTLSQLWGRNLGVSHIQGVG